MIRSTVQKSVELLGRTKVAGVLLPTAIATMLSGDVDVEPVQQVDPIVQEYEVGKLLVEASTNGLSRQLIDPSELAVTVDDHHAVDLSPSILDTKIEVDEQVVGSVTKDITEVDEPKWQGNKAEEIVITDPEPEIESVVSVEVVEEQPPVIIEPEEVATQNQQQLVEQDQSNQQVEDQSVPAELRPGIQHLRPEGWTGATAPEDRIPVRDGKKIIDPEPISSEIRQDIEENVAYLDPIGCSAYIHRNDAGQPAYATTAQHCGFYDKDLNKQLFEDGSEYVLGSYRVQTGSQINQLTDQGRVTHIITPELGADSNTDFSVLVFEGTDPEEVLARLDLTPPELKFGDTAYLAGWPVDQDHNAGPMRRQVHEMVYLGRDSFKQAGEKGTPYHELNDINDVYVFVIKSNGDGAECSYGNSGGTAFTKDGKPFGALALFEEFTLDTIPPGEDDNGNPLRTKESQENLRAAYEERYGIELGEYDTICMISTNPDFKQNAKITPVVDPVEEDQIKFEQLQQKVAEAQESALDALHDSSQPKTYINGTVTTFPLEEGLWYPTLAHNPIVHTMDDGGVLMYWHSGDIHAQEKGGFGNGFYFRYFTPEETPLFYAYDTDDLTDDQLVGQTEGQLLFEDDGHYYDVNGNAVAGYTGTDVSPVDTTRYRLLTIEETGNTLIP